MRLLVALPALAFLDEALGLVHAPTSPGIELPDFVREQRAPAHR